MSLTRKQATSLEGTIKNSLRKRFATYNPEPAAMPFHVRLLGEDRLALYAFIHSLNTNFGTTIFEPVAMEIAKDNFMRVEKQAVAGNKISTEAEKIIQEIMDELNVASRLPNKPEEIERIRAVAQKGEFREIKPTRIDLYLEDEENNIYLFDIKTAKPNRGAFKEFKRTLLEWTAVMLAQYPTANINTLIAIPYNPYAPKPYSRWTMAGMLDLEHELKVAEEFWDFLGGEGTYEDLLTCFERVGIEMRDEIDEYFSRFKK
jgi:type II restriction enzyme